MYISWYQCEENEMLEKKVVNSFITKWRKISWNEKYKVNENYYSIIDISGEDNGIIGTINPSPSPMPQAAGQP